MYVYINIVTLNGFSLADESVFPDKHLFVCLFVGFLLFVLSSTLYYLLTN